MGIQVTELTQGKQPWETEFIDFEFAGKKLSEFGWVAVSSGDRLSFGHSPTFEDEISEVNGVDGQYFWGTHFKNINRTFKIATDGITEAEWNAFKIHFVPGKYGKFIENHLYHRYSYCRIADVIVMDVVPFRKKTTFMGKEIYINIYKGEATITFEWDLPKIYASENLLVDTNLSDDEQIRVMYANGTPTIASSQGINKDIYIGTGGKLNNGVYTESVSFSKNSDQDILSYYNPSTTKTALNLSLTFNPTITEQNSSNWIPVYFSNIADEINQISANYSLPYNTITSSGSHGLSQEPLFDKSFYYSSPSFIYLINRAIQIGYEYYTLFPTGNLLELEERIREEIINLDVASWAASVLAIIKTKENYYDSESGNLKTGVLSVPDLQKVSEPVLKYRYAIYQSDGTTLITSSQYIYSSDWDAYTAGISWANSAQLDSSSYLVSTDSSQVIEKAYMSLNWFGYFNYFMLMIIGERGSGENFQIDADDSWTANYYPYTINFNSENNQTTMSYSYNSITSTVEKNSVLEKPCGDMVYSEYLESDGGDTLDNNGKIATIHSLDFLQGGQSQTISDIKLQYKYTYI